MLKHEGFIKPQDEAGVERQKIMFLPRTVKKLQSNGVQLSNGSWLYFDGAKGFKFDGTDTFVVDLGHDGRFSRVMRYQCSLQPSAKE